MRRRTGVLPLVCVAGLVACTGTPDVPAALLQPDDLQGLEVVEAEPDLPLRSLAPCGDARDPHRDLRGSGESWRYVVEVGDEDDFVVTAALRPDEGLRDELLRSLPTTAEQCPDGLLDDDPTTAADAAAQAGLTADDVLVYRTDEGVARAYAVVGDQLVVVGTGARVGTEVDLAALVSSAVVRAGGA